MRRPIDGRTSWACNFLLVLFKCPASAPPPKSPEKNARTTLCQESESVAFIQNIARLGPFQMRTCREIKVLYWMLLKAFAKKFKLHHKSRQMARFKHPFLTSHFHRLSAACIVPRCHEFSRCRMNFWKTMMKNYITT